MKGIISILEVLTVGIILLMALIFFFPRYIIKSEWSSALLSIKARDTLNTIDRMNKTLEFAKNQTKFDDFMRNVFIPSTSGALIWWRETNDLGGYTEDTEIPYFTEGYKETIVDVEFVEYFVDSDTVAIWHFNEGIGDITYDETANNNDGTLQGGMDLTGWTTDCISGSCLEFDGMDDYVDIPDSDSLHLANNSDSFTVEAWVKADEIKSSVFVTKYGTFFLGMTGDSKYYIYLDSINEGWHNAGCNARCVMNSDEWYHVAMTYDAATSSGSCYCNGTNVASFINTTGNLAYTTQQARIGMWGPTLYFNGIIDEVRILNRTLSPDEVRADYNRFNVHSFTLGLGYPY